MTYIHNINPIAFSMGPFDIYYYGLSYGIGVLIIFFFLYRQIMKGNIHSFSKERLWDLGIYGLTGLMLGGRLGYVFFYDPLYYFSHPFSLFALWEGGMSFHGALIGIIISGYLFCKRFSVSFLHLADFVVIPLSIALLLGRLANFVNAELYGKLTTVAWGVVFPNVDNQIRHPSQLYEALKNGFIFILLLLLSIYLRKKEKKESRAFEGVIFFAFIFLYGLLRFLVEFFREPEIMVGILTMGQILSVFMIILGGSGLFYTYFYALPKTK